MNGTSCNLKPLRFAQFMSDFALPFKLENVDYFEVFKSFKELLGKHSVIKAEVDTLLTRQCLSTPHCGR